MQRKYTFCSKKGVCSKWLMFLMRLDVFKWRKVGELLKAAIWLLQRKSTFCRAEK